MGTPFEDAFASQARPQLLKEFGKTVKYKRPDGSEKEITGMVCDELDEMRAEADGESEHDRMTLQISDNVTDGIPDPGPNDTVEIDGEDWAVEVIETRQGGLSLIRLIRRRQTIKSHESYRREVF